VDTSTCSTIADLEYLIKKRFIALSKSWSSVDLFLEDYLLPSQEKIEIIQNNDNIRVEVRQMIIKQAGREEDCDDQERVKRRKQNKRLPDASNKSKRKQVDNSEEALNERKKKRIKPPENGVQDVNNTERNNKAKKKKKSTKDRKNPIKEPKMAKQVQKKHKPNLSTHTVTKNNNVSSLAQEERKYTKALALTGVVNSQLSKSSRPSKEKSNMEEKSGNPSQRVSSKSNVGKGKSNLEPLKTNSKKSKTSANGKGKDLITGKKTVNGIVTGKRAVDSDTSSSESSIESSSSSSSPTESSSESTDESGPSTSHSKVNGTVSRIASAELINNDKLPMHEIQHKIAKDSSVRKTGKDETGVSLKLHTNSKGNGAIGESSSSSESSTDTDKSADAVRKDTRSLSSSSSSSSSSSESEEEKAKLDGNKETSSSLLHPLLSSPSSQSFPSPSLLRGIQMQETNETSANQSPIHSITEKISLFGQKQAQQSTSRRQNKKPGSRNSTSHIRFDSEESDEETVEEQQEVCSTKDITDDFNSTPPSSNISASEQNHQASSEKAASECKEPLQRDYSLCTPLHGPPRSKDKIAYKVLELSASYTPEVSSYKEGTVVDFDASSGAITIELSKESLKKTRGDGNITGKFELVYDESEENVDNLEEDPEVVVPWNAMIDPVLIE